MQQFEADIEVFWVLALIAESNKLTDTRWAKAAKMPQPRIGELRQIRRLMHADGYSQEEASAKIRRQCTRHKIYNLYRGLANLLGEDYMKKELDSVVKKEKDPRRRIDLLTLQLADDDLRQAEDFLKLLVLRKKPESK